MIISEYIEACGRFDNHDERGMIDALVHGAVNEAIELWDEVCGGNGYWSRSKALLELGDVAWNLARLAGELLIPVADLEAVQTWPRPTEVSHEGPAVEFLLRRAGKLAALMEKAHRKDGLSYGAAEESVVLAWSGVHFVARMCSWSMEEVMQANIDKLTARYAERGLSLREA